MAHINCCTALLLVVVASAVSSYSIPRLSDLQKPEVSELLKLKHTQEYLENPVAHIASEENIEELNDQYIKLLRQFDVMPNKVNKRQNDEEVNKQNEADEVTETQNEAIENNDEDDDDEIEKFEPLVEKQERQYDGEVESLDEIEDEKDDGDEETVEKKKHLFKKNKDAIEDSDDDDDNDDDESDDYDANTQIDNKRKRHLGDAPIDENDENLEEQTNGEGVEIKKIKRQNEEKNKVLDVTENKQGSDIVERKIKAMFVNRLNKIMP